MTITVPRPGQREREATLELRTTVVQMARPGQRAATAPSAPPLTAVLAREIAPPDEVKPIEWLLLTTLAVATPVDAERIVTWYSYRWRIERRHFTLKSGGVRSKTCNEKVVSGWNGPLRSIPLSLGACCG